MDTITGYVINLDSRTDRWEAIQREFKGTPIQLERVSAVEDRNGWLGCAKSHLKIVKMAKDMNLPQVLVLEDDCKLRGTPEEFRRNWKVILEFLQTNPDAWNIQQGGVHQQNNEKLLTELSDGIRLFNFERGQATHFLLIQSTVQDQVLENSEQIQSFEELREKGVEPEIRENLRKQIAQDNQLFRIPKRVISYPFLVIQTDGQSNVTGIDRQLNDIFTRSETRLTTQLRDLFSPSKKEGWANGSGEALQNTIAIGTLLLGTVALYFLSK